MNELIIHLICPDQKGIIARFTHELYQNKINIISLEQHVEPDENMFFMRIHADIRKMALNNNQFDEFIDNFKSKLKAQIDYYNYLKPLKMAIFCTKEETPVLELILKQKSGDLNCTIPLIISNHETLSDVCKRHHINFYHIFSNKI